MPLETAITQKRLATFMVVTNRAHLQHLRAGVRPFVLTYCQSRIAAPWQKVQGLQFYTNRPSSIN
jgi:hypothetical protein